MISKREHHKQESLLKKENCLDGTMVKDDPNCLDLLSNYLTKKLRLVQGKAKTQ